MNRLSTERRAQIIGMLVKGMSMRAISRLTGASINTVTKLLSDAADAAAAYHDAKAGDTWTFVAMDSESKLIVSYQVGPRDGQTALALMDDLRKRVEDRPQISTDGLKAYVIAVDGASGGGVDFAQIVKTYGTDDNDDRKYSPPVWTGMDKVAVWDNPDMEIANTSYVERQNLSMRMGMRRFARLTNEFSKQLEKHCAMLALFYHYYNHIKPHGAVRTNRDEKVTPAMAAGLTDRPGNFTELVELVDARAPKVRYAKTYRKRAK